MVKILQIVHGQDTTKYAWSGYCKVFLGRMIQSVYKQDVHRPRI